MTASDHLGPQWYHGTTASLRPGDQVEPGRAMSHGGTGRHVYMTRSAGQAGVYASRAYTTHGNVYEVEPTGPYEGDPGHTMTDEHGPLHARSSSPLKVVRHVSSSGPLKRSNTDEDLAVAP